MVLQLSHLRHLATRAVTSMSNRAPSGEEMRLAQEVLNDAEYEIWLSMDGRDQRHSLQVLARFDALRPHAVRDVRAAALLHDLGKREAHLGWVLRVVATVVGPRSRRFSVYHDHEKVGLQLLQGISSERTLAILDSDATAEVMGLGPDRDALRRADDV